MSHTESFQNHFTKEQHYPYRNIQIAESSIIPPLFTYTDENFELDFGLLSEYIAEDDRVMNMMKSESNSMSLPSNFSYSHGSNVPATVSNENSDNEADSYSSDDDNKRKRFISSDKPRNKDQVDRRRERNRVLAKKTRLRKKFFFESLQRQVAQLATENEMLKSIVKQRLTNEVKLEILSQCRTEVPPIVTATAQQATSLLEKADYRLMAAIHAAQRSFVISDPSLPDNPIIFASKGFLDLTGYRLDEVLGRNCRFLQGPKTDQHQVDLLRKGIQDGVDTAVCLLNYKRNGTPFYNQIFVAALRDVNYKIINYVGVQVEIQDYNENDQTLISAQNPSNNSPTRKPSQSFTADDFRSAMTSINNSSSNKDLFRMPSFDSASYHNQEFDTQDTSNHFMNENIMNIATTPAYIKQEPVSFNDQNIGNTSNTMDDFLRVFEENDYAQSNKP